MLPVLIFAMTFGADTPPSDAAPEAAARRAAELVRQFESQSFRKREAAAREILEIGAPSRPALEAGLLSADAEVRERCRRLLPAVQSLDLELRVAAFLKDEGGTGKHGLPGWEAFRKKVGADRESREFFAKMIRRVPEASYLLDREPARLARYMNGRMREIAIERDLADDRPRRKGNEPKFSYDAVEIAFWIFVNSDDAVREAGRQGNEDENFGYYLNDNLFERALADAKTKDIYHRIVLGWLRSLKDQPGDLNEMDSGLSYARDHDVKGALDVALDWIDRKPKESGVPEFLAIAMTVVGKFGDNRHVPRLATYLANEAEFTTINVRQKNYVVQYRDIALAMTLHIQGLKPRAFGFDMLNNNGVVFYPHYLGFPTDEARKKAFAAYGDYLRK